MDPDDLLGATSCPIDDELPDLMGRLRQRGQDPSLDDAEVVTIEVVGEFLGMDQDTVICAYVRRYAGAWVPALWSVHRATFTRQATRLWVVNERVWRSVPLAAHCRHPGSAVCATGYCEPGGDHVCQWTSDPPSTALLTACEVRHRFV